MYRWKCHINVSKRLISKDGMQLHDGKKCICKYIWNCNLVSSVCLYCKCPVFLFFYTNKLLRMQLKFPVESVGVGSVFASAEAETPRANSDH